MQLSTVGGFAVSKEGERGQWNLVTPRSDFRSLVDLWHDGGLVRLVWFGVLPIGLLGECSGGRTQGYSAPHLISSHLIILLTSRIWPVSEVSLHSILISGAGTRRGAYYQGGHT